MDITLEMILTVFSSLFATGLIGVVVFWLTKSVWPWYAARDAEERERQYILAQGSKTTQESMAVSLASVDHSLKNTIKVSLVDRQENPTAK